MTRFFPALAAVGLVAILASCGADGAPTPPRDQPASGITVTGQAKIGISG